MKEPCEPLVSPALHADSAPVTSNILNMSHIMLELCLVKSLENLTESKVQSPKNLSVQDLSLY